jgi:hypothetical protein
MAAKGQVALRQRAVKLQRQDMQRQDNGYLAAKIANAN